jgi:hypothetical protein
MINNEKKQAPRCPYCGSKMRYKQGLLCRTLHWYECTNEECESESPARNTAEEAYEKAMRRYEEPNRVLTLDELKTYIGYAWYEGDHKWYHSSFDYPVWIEDGKYNYEGDLYDIPDVEGRFWLRKPTKAELDAKREDEDER